MRVFITGATGFIGSIVIEELRAAGHDIAGLARSDAAAATLEGRGVRVIRGDVAEPDTLAEAARASDGVIHCAFGHDFSRYVEMGEIDLRAVEALVGALAGSGKPLVVTSGMTAGVYGRVCAEADPADLGGATAVRGRPEVAALAAADQGVRASVVRLPPSVHDRGQQGLVSLLVITARQTGVAAYVGEGANRWPAVHRRDAASLFARALEHGHAGERLHAVGEEGLTMRAIAEAIGEKLALPVRSLAPEEAFAHFGWIAPQTQADLPASSAVTQASVGWRPSRPGLIAGLLGDYLD